MNPPWVKICGLTRPDDVEASIRSGADAIGLVLVARSPRRIGAQRASELAAISAGRAQVVLLVDGAADVALTTARRVGADAVQPYGAAAVAIASAALATGLDVLFPVPVADDLDIDIGRVPAGARPLLDTAVGESSGGTGVSFAWERARGFLGIVIAGGLAPHNVAAAVSAARPWGVDASSGLEAAVGVKDHGKVSSFIEAAKSA